MSIISPAISFSPGLSPSRKTSVGLAQVWEPIAEEMVAAQDLYREMILASSERNYFHEILTGSGAYIPEEYRLGIVERIGRHFLGTEGKWIRAGLVLLSAHSFGAHSPSVRKVAVAVELVHLATLTHDDVIDEAEMRRGLVSVCHGWGNSIAVLMGDFLFSKALKLVLESRSVASQEALAVASGQMCVGEIKQLRHVHGFHTSETEYLETIENKTAALMAACTQSGAELAGCRPGTVKMFSRIGLDIGMAFQIVDDILDYTSTLRTMGKEQGGDLRNGKLTLPLIHLLQRRPDLLKTIREVDYSGGFVEKLRKQMLEEGSLEYSYDLARRYIGRARESLNNLRESSKNPDGIDSLLTLSELILSRDS
ncbi:MAG TPA: polyprenyl synthetase family protein [bacterium]|nr:polyprenyl synthetase family protein [bacterium]HQL62591.1 polyprenyl synthetase family protein [bacterium]